MSGRFVRASKYRHVFGDFRKDEAFTGVARPNTAGEGQNVAVSGDFVAIPMTGGGGPVAVLKRDTPRRLGAGEKVLNVHSAKVTDVAFSPFNSSVIACASEDCKVSVTVLPAGGIGSENVTAASGLSSVFGGHQKKVQYVRFHPTTNVLASSGADNAIKVWDLIEGTEMYSIDSPEAVSDLAFNSNGSRLAAVSKDKRLRLYDPRVAGSVQETESFEGTKAAKLFWADNLGMIGAVGFTRTSVRQHAVWDPRNLGAPLAREDIDQAPGIFFPQYDEDTSILYLTGKGEGSIRYYELTSEKPFVHALSAYRDSSSTKGIGWLPKRYVDTTKCEVALAYRLLGDSVVPISFQVPRKSDLFQPDIFPDTFAGIPAMAPDEWQGGKDADPAKMSLKPGADSGAAAAAAAAASALPTKSRSQLQAELDTANARIAELEAEVAKLKA